MGAIKSLTSGIKARAAAATHRWPARKARVIFVSGQDGGELTAICLGHILQRNGAKVGIITPLFIEIGGERARGSDQADVFGDPFRFQGLLAQMRRAGCAFVIIHLPQTLPRHMFSGITPVMAIQSRCGDRHAAETANGTRKAAWRRLLGLHPQFTVVNRDDPCYAKPAQHVATVMSFGTHEKAECKITKVAMHPQGMQVKVVIDHQTEIILTSEVTGKSAVFSMVAAAAAAYLLQVPVDVIAAGVAGVPAQPTQVAYVPAQRPYAVVLDSAITPDGLVETLETLRHFTKNRLVVVIGANLAQLPAWRHGIGEIAAEYADRLIVTDGEYTHQESPQTVRQQLLDGVVAAGGDPKTEEVPDRKEALEKAISIARRDDTVVVLATTPRPYRQLGNERLPWSDRALLEELL